MISRVRDEVQSFSIQTTVALLTHSAAVQVPAYRPGIRFYSSFKHNNLTSFVGQVVVLEARVESNPRTQGESDLRSPSPQGLVHISLRSMLHSNPSPQGEPPSDVNLCCRWWTLRIAKAHLSASPLQHRVSLDPLRIPSYVRDSMPRLTAFARHRG